MAALAGEKSTGKRMLVMTGMRALLHWGYCRQDAGAGAGRCSLSKRNRREPRSLKIGEQLPQSGTGQRLFAGVDRLLSADAVWATMKAMDRSRVIETLRGHSDELRAAGVVHLSVFGSVARGDQSARSDVD